VLVLMIINKVLDEVNQLRIFWKTGGTGYLRYARNAISNRVANTFGAKQGALRSRSYCFLPA
jgi:hypothetical protein